jgi:DNA-binding MarR family transcriptional regulator
MPDNDDARDLFSSPTGDDSPSSSQNLRFDYRILQSLRKIIRAVDIHSRKLADGHDITAPQLVCLLAVVEKETSTTKELAQRVHLSPCTVVGILDRLEKKGLVKRLRDTVDRRVVNVMATAAGRTLANNAPSPLQEGLADALKRLSEMEQATIALSLERIVDLMEARDIDAAPILETGRLDQTADEKKLMSDKNTNKNGVSNLGDDQ